VHTVSYVSFVVIRRCAAYLLGTGGNGRRWIENVPINFCAVPISIYVSTMVSGAAAFGRYGRADGMHYCGAKIRRAACSGDIVRWHCDIGCYVA
jgi:hypothetical protein